MKILVIRRDNIGDLILTTPLIAALRDRFKDAWIGALVNTYNAPALQYNPDLDAVYAYEKAKHREAGVPWWRPYWDRWNMIRELRGMQIDYALVAGPACHARPLALAKQVRPRHIVAHVHADWSPPEVDCPVALPPTPVHAAAEAFSLATVFGIEGTAPSLRVCPSPQGQPATANKVGRVVGIHLSARKPSQRWPIERFAELMRSLAARHAVQFRVYWAPGAADDPRHPGDDSKAAALLSETRDLAVTPCPTATLRALIDAMAGCDLMVCSDGGAMHVAAGLGIPIVCFFGQSEAARWHPWGVPFELLQPESRDVVDVSAAMAMAAAERLWAAVEAASPRSAHIPVSSVPTVL